jgi:hypothetical protein
MTLDPFIATTIDELRTIIRDLPDEMKVEVAKGVLLQAKTVRELRALSTFPRHEKLRVVIPSPNPW